MVATGIRALLIEAFNTAYEPLPIEDPSPELVKGQRHDGHQLMGSCLVCRGDVAALADRVLGVVGTWQGLMSLLDEYYPPEVFDGSSGDEGPRIVALLRAVDAERSSRQAWAEEALHLDEQCDAARGAEAAAVRKLGEAIELLAQLADPTPCGHFDHHGACQTHGSGPGRCSHETAKRFLAGFSRPVCAVHPEGGAPT